MVEVVLDLGEANAESNINVSLQDNNSINKEEDFFLAANDIVDEGSSEASSHEIDTASNYFDKDTVKLTANVLKKYGLERHLNSIIGGSLSKSTSHYVIERTATMLCWTYANKLNYSLSKKGVLQWFRQIIKKEYNSLRTFVLEHLESFRGYSPLTILNYLNDLGKSFSWFIWFRENRTKKVYINVIYEKGGFQKMLKRLKKNIKKSANMQRANNAINNVVNTQQLPKGGIVQLQECLLNDEIPWALLIGNEVAVTKCTYNRFLAVLVASMYVFSPQGRIGGYWSEVLSELIIFIFKITFLRHPGHALWTI